MKSLNSITCLGFCLLSLTLAVPAQAKPGVHDCQRKGPFTVCGADDAPGTVYRVTYDGYLKDSGAEVRIQGWVNGQRFDSALNTFNPGSPMFQLVAVPAGEKYGHLTIYAVDSFGRYDSNYSKNYDFDLR